MVKTVLGAMLITFLPVGFLLAQQPDTPDVYAQPLYGYSATDPGTTATPNYGGPDYGRATRSPDGRICVSTPGLIGKPQYGTTVTCYSDETQPSGRDAASPDGTGRAGDYLSDPGLSDSDRGPLKRGDSGD